MPANRLILLIAGVMAAAALTVMLGAWASERIGPGAAQGFLLGTVAMAAALLILRRPRR